MKKVSTWFLLGATLSLLGATFPYLPPLPFFHPPTYTLYLVDVSESTSVFSDGELLSWIRSFETAHPSDYFSLALFARSFWLLRPMASAGALPFPDTLRTHISAIEGRSTRLKTALDEALAYLQSFGGRKRLVLLTDGHSTEKLPHSYLFPTDFHFIPILLDGHERDPVRITQPEIPSSIPTATQELSLSFTLETSPALPVGNQSETRLQQRENLPGQKSNSLEILADVTLYQILQPAPPQAHGATPDQTSPLNQENSLEQKIPLWEHRYTLTPPAQHPIFITAQPRGSEKLLTFQLQITSLNQPDLFPQNNTLLFRVRRGNTPIVCLWGNTPKTSFFPAAVFSSFILLHHPAEITSCDLFILEDISDQTLRSLPYADIQKAIVTAGKGLWVVAGPGPDALTQFNGTDWPPLLPFDPLPRQTFSLYILMDLSGSMSEEAPSTNPLQNSHTKFDYVFSALHTLFQPPAFASASSVELFKPHDAIGLMGFRTHPIDLLSFKSWEEQKNNLSDLFNLQAHPHFFPTGATFIAPALRRILQTLGQVHEGKKILLILSDGKWMDAPPELQALIKKIADQKITPFMIVFTDSTFPNTLPSGPRLFKQLLPSFQYVFFRGFSKNLFDTLRHFLQETLPRRIQTSFSLYPQLSALRSSSFSNSSFLSGARLLHRVGLKTRTLVDGLAVLPGPFPSPGSTPPFPSLKGQNPSSQPAILHWPLGAGTVSAWLFPPPEKKLLSPSSIQAWENLIQRQIDFLLPPDRQSPSFIVSQPTPDSLCVTLFSPPGQIRAPEHKDSRAQGLQSTSSRSNFPCSPQNPFSQKNILDELSTMLFSAHYTPLSTFSLYRVPSPETLADSTQVIFQGCTSLDSTQPPPAFLRLECFPEKHSRIPACTGMTQGTNSACSRENQPETRGTLYPLNLPFPPEILFFGPQVQTLQQLLPPHSSQGVTRFPEVPRRLEKIHPPKNSSLQIFFLLSSFIFLAWSILVQVLHSA